MAKNEAKILFTAQTEKFNDEIKKSNETMAQLRAEMRYNETQMKATGTTVEGLENKHKILSAQLDASKDKTEALSQKVNKAVEIFGENSSEVARLKLQLTNAKIAEEKLEQAVNKAKQEVLEQSVAMAKTETATDKLNAKIEEQESTLQELKRQYANLVIENKEATDEAKNLENAIRELSGELKQNKTAISQASDKAEELDRELEEVEEQAENTADGFTVMRGAMANLVSSGIQGAISGIGNLASTFLGLAEDTKEYRTIMASLEQSSKLAGYSTEETSAIFEKLNGVLGDTQSASTTTANLQAIGLEQGKLQTLTDGVIGAWAKYGDSIPIDGLGEAVNHTVQLGEVQGTLADVLEWGGITVDDFNSQLEKCSNETQRADLIAKMLANQGLTEAGKAWQETNKDIIDTNNAQADYERNTATLAERVAPVTTAISEGFNSIFETCLNLTEGTDFEGFGTSITSAFETFTGDILPKIAEGITSTIEGIKEATQWMNEHKTVLAVVASAVGVLAVAIGAYNVVQGIKAAMDAAQVTTVWALVAAHWAQATAAMAAIAPYVLVVAAIAAVIAIIVLCVKHWDEIVLACKNAWEAIKETLATWGEWLNVNVVQPIKTFFTELWENIKTTAISVWDGIKSFFASIPSWFSENVINPIVNFFTGLWQGLQSIWDGICNAVSIALQLIASIISAAFQIITLPFQFIWENCKEYVFVAWEWIKEKVSTGINAVKETITKVMNAIKTAFTNAWNAVKDVFTTAWNAIVNFLKPILDTIKNTITNVWNAIKNTVTSVMDGVKSVITTAWNNIKSVISNVLNAIKSTISNVFNAVKNVVSNVFNAIKNTASNIWNGVKTVISNAVNGAKNTISNVFNSVKSTVSNVFNSIKSTATNVWNGVKNAILKPIEDAKAKIKSIIDTIKGFFSGMKLSFPNIKMPHFAISPKGWKIGDLLQGSIPKLSIQWYADGGIFTKPTIFPTASGYKGVGEAGAEAVLPIDRLEGYIINAIEKTMNMANIDKLAQAVEDLASRPVNMYINDRHIATATASASDSINGMRNILLNRGLAIE